MTTTSKDYDHQLMDIGCKLHEVAMTIAYIGDNLAAGELMKLERALRSFAINPALRARAGGKRTSEEWHKCSQFMLNISKIHKDFAEAILRDLAAAVEEVEEEVEDEALIAEYEVERSRIILKIEAFCQRCEYRSDPGSCEDCELHSITGRSTKDSAVVEKSRDKE